MDSLFDPNPPPPPNEPAARYAVHVLVDVAPDSAPSVPREALAEAVRRRLLSATGAGSPTDTSPGDGSERTDDSDGPTVRVDDPGATPAATLSEAAMQTWDWPGLPSIVPRCKTAYIIHHDDPSLDRSTRLLLVRATAESLLEVLEAEGVESVALLWEPAQRLVHPAAFRESLAHGGAVGDYGLNVRLFEVPDGGPGERLMDTRGLSAFGLPDLQCRFTDLPPGAIAAHLMSYAEYLFDKGDVIADGDVVRGLESEDEWECVRGHSLAIPAREVIDVRPQGHASAHPGATSPGSSGNPDNTGRN